DPADVLDLARRRGAAVFWPLRTGGTVGWVPRLARRTPELQRCLLLFARHLRDAGLWRHRAGAGLPHLWRAWGHLRLANAWLVDRVDLGRHQPCGRPRSGLNCCIWDGAFRSGFLGKTQVVGGFWAPAPANMPLPLSRRNFALYWHCLA